jgi:hypothetical protein
MLCSQSLVFQHFILRSRHSTHCLSSYSLLSYPLYSLSTVSVLLLMSKSKPVPDPFPINERCFKKKGKRVCHLCHGSSRYAPSLMLLGLTDTPSTFGKPKRWEFRFPAGCVDQPPTPRPPPPPPPFFLLLTTTSLADEGKELVAEDVGERHCCLSITPLMRKSSPQRKEILRRRKR